MWIFRKISDGSTKYLISGNKLYTIGRKNCDITLENDASISRKHCNIHVAKQSECPFPVSTLTGVWVVDEQSKYGSYLKDKSDWIKINPNENKKLTNGSVIKFGLMDNIWSLEFKPVVACVSGIPTDQKKKIESTLQSIDGLLRNAWCKECSMVIVNEITLTVKVVLALINGVPIVTPNYVEKVVESVKNHSPFPNYENYRPFIKESILDKTLVSLDIKNNRKELFRGIKFIIPTKKQLDTLKDVVLSAGGTVELLMSVGKLERFIEENVIVIQLPLNNSGIPEDLCKSFKEISTFLKNSGRRIVPESEIAQAVAYSSTEKFCNPKSTCFNLRIGERKQVDLGPVIVEETPTTTEKMTKSSGFGVVPSSETVNTENSLDGTVESEPPPLHKTIEEINLSNVGKSCAERKRTHSPNPIEHEIQKKKARNKSCNDDDDSSKGIEKTSNSSKGAGEPISKNLSQTKGSCITNYFQKQKPAEKQLARQASTGFWDCDTVSVKSLKRKFSNENDDSSDNSNSTKKKSKLPETNASKPTTPDLDTPREVVKVVQQNSNSIDSVSFPPIQRNFPEEEEDLTGYFGREETSNLDFQIDDLNNTIFSLAIISPAFVKEDGTLIDPPSVPVNVKRFKKQKILSSAILQSLGEQDEVLSDGEWIEPHSNRLNISVVEGNDW